VRHRVGKRFQLGRSLLHAVLQPAGQGPQFFGQLPLPRHKPKQKHRGDAREQVGRRFGVLADPRQGRLHALIRDDEQLISLMEGHHEKHAHEQHGAPVAEAIGHREGVGGASEQRYEWNDRKGDHL
jgi:hypothetical protein